MYALFVCKKDSNGLEYIQKQGKNHADELRAHEALASCRKGFLIDMGEENLTGQKHYGSFLARGHKVCAAKNMPKIEAALAVGA